MTWVGAPGDALADTIVLEDGEVIEGSIIDATRNTVVVQRTIGGMRQMPLREIKEVRVELAQGRRISGQLLSWTDGVYQVRSGGQVIRIAEGDILSRGTAEESPGEPQRDTPPVGPQTVRMAAGPPTSAPEETAADRTAPAREQMAAPRAAGEARRPARDADQSPAAGQEQSVAAADAAPSPAADEQQRAAEEPSPTAAEKQSAAATDGPTPASAGEEQSAALREEQHLADDDEQNTAAADQQSPAAGEERSLAAVEESESPATGAQESLVVVKTSVVPAEPGADQMVFRIELSRPAEQTLVLIYGTVEGTAKAGEDFEPKQGIVTLAPGSERAEVHVPLLESSAQGERRFELFLTADPKVAEILDRRVAATINGAD